MGVNGHALYSPSAAHRWMACPASWAAERLVPEIAPGFAARQGTAVHEVAAKCVTMLAEPESFANAIVAGVPITMDDITPLRVYIDLVIQTARSSTSALFTEYPVRAVSISADLGGTVDAAVVDENTLTVFDLKFGTGVKVEATENPQASIYALGMLDSLPQSTKAAIDSVNIVIVQPRWHNDNDRIRVWNTTQTDLRHWGDETLRPAIKATRQPTLTFRAGPHCTFCRYRASCKTLEAYQQQVTITDPTDIPNDILAELLQTIPLVELRITALRDLALARAKQGQILPGFHLEETYSHRKWHDPQAAAQQLNDAGYSDIFETKLHSPAYIEKMLGKKRLELIPETTKDVTGVKLVQDTKPKVPNLPTWAI